MSYREALQAAQADVLEFETFGSYQGDWFALVKYHGNTFWVHGSYGSCSGCDSFEAEFDYSEETCAGHRYETPPVDCAECLTARQDYQRRLADFGRSYLVGGEMTQAEAERLASEHLEWDGDAQEMLDFVKAHAFLFAPPPMPPPMPLNNRS